MKFKLLAIAAATLVATSAYAQSSVTLYGVADVGVEYLSHAGGDHSAVRMSSGNYSGSRWGLRGVEDLGGGLKGIFALESGFNMDTGGASDSNRLFNRQAFVGLQSNYGTVTLGRQQTLLYDFGLVYDPMAIASRYSILAQDPAFASRADNAIKYTGTFGGLTASALYSFRYDGQEVAGNLPKGAEYSAALNYAAGPMSIGAVYDQLRLGFVTGATSDSKLQRASIAGNYAFGPAKAFAGYRWANQTVPAAHVRSNLYWAGLGYQVTPALSLAGAAYYQDFARTKSDPWTFVLSADYALSKRTDVYLNMAYALNKEGSGFGVSSAVADLPGDHNQFGAVVGVRHKF